MHPNGKRYIKDCAQKKSIKTEEVTMCWKKHKCDDPLCSSSHPSCRNSNSCTNSKCGFVHHDGRRYTGTITSTLPDSKPHQPLVASRIGTISAQPISSSITLSKCDAVSTMGTNNNRNLDRLRNKISNVKANLKSPLDTQISCTDKMEPVDLFTVGKLVKAYGKVIDIEEGRISAQIQPALHCFAKHSEFHLAATKTGVYLDIKQIKDHQNCFPFQTLVVGDTLYFQVYLNCDQNLVACHPRYKKITSESRSCNELISLIDVGISGIDFNEHVLHQILDLDLASHLVVGAMLVKTHHVWTDCSQVLRAKKLQALFIKTSFLCRHGSFCKQLSNLSDVELLAAHDMLGSMCVLNVKDTCILVHASSLLAQRLGSAGVSLLSGILAVSVPLQNSVSLSHYAWWQLPSVPLMKDVTCTEAYGVTDMKTLPSVLVGKPYPNIDAYISTYMRLYRADCFALFLSRLKEKMCGGKKGLQSDDVETELVICGGLGVCGMHVSTTTGEIDVQLGCTVENPKHMQHNTFALTHMVCISLTGDFRDNHLIWAVVSVPPDGTIIHKGFGENIVPSQSGSTAESQIKGCRLVFGLRFCSKVNSMSDKQILEEIQKNQDTARLIENPVSFISFEPVLDALRSLWRPGQPVTLPFSETLLTGKSVPALDANFFFKVGKELGIPRELDQFQLEAYKHVGAQKLALIQGPPGCGKSYLGSRLCRILAQTSGRVLVVTSKNHSLDEILTDITAQYGKDGLSNIIRIGNSKKIALELKARTLQAEVATGRYSNDMNSSDSHQLQRIASQCNTKCSQLQNEITLTSDNFAQAAGSAGVYTVCQLLGRHCTFSKSSFADDPLESREYVDSFLYEWAKAAITRLKEESKVYWKKFAAGNHNNLELEQHLWKIEQQQHQDNTSEIESFAEMNPYSLMGVMVAFGLSSNEMLASSMPELDISSMLNWGLESRTYFLLSVLRFDFSRLTNSFSELASTLAPLQEGACASRLKRESEVLQSVPIIGSTILGVLLNMDAIAAAKPKVLLLEEAGEIPEATLIAILRMPSLERCVMIGDHQQLRPTTNSYELRVHKKLDVSCFERLVELNVKKSVLRTQNRMRKDVLLPVLQHYPGIVSNNAVIQCIKPVPWLISPLFWWVCEQPGVKQHASWYNKEQGQRAVRLASFLVDQESSTPHKITILVPYSSQLLFTRMLLRQSGKSSVHVSTIDNYQGDENDIIILCLVRCDHDNPTKLGFLGDTNRMIVATSRQKKALIIIGSEFCFATNGAWKTLQDQLKQEPQGNSICKLAKIGCKLPICCPRHPTKMLLILDSLLFPASGCGEGCGMPLKKCLHKCSLKCHPIMNTAHGSCKKMVDYTHLSCKHTFQYQCYAIPQLCPKEVQIILPKCGHNQKTTCGKFAATNLECIKCNETCSIQLSCSHEVWLRCGSSTDGYISKDFNACPTCLLQSIGITPDHDTVSKLINQCSVTTSKKGTTNSKSYNLITRNQMRLVSDAVQGTNLCDNNQISLVQTALCRAKLPAILINSALPNPSMWDPHESAETQRTSLESSIRQQGLWCVLLQESGFRVPVEWQKQSLVLLAGIALNCVENRTSLPSCGETDAEIFFDRLQILNEASICSSQDLIAILKDAGETLYKALSRNSVSEEHWYNLEEGQLARIITSRLLAATSSDKCCKNTEHTKYEFDLVKVRGQISNSNLHSTTFQHRRVSWGLPANITGDIHAPPYQEVGHDFLYRSSLAGSLYISLDLKSADFHVLRLAVPKLIQETTWALWVQQTIPGLVKRVPFLAEMKPLRVRVLGKMLHKKNAALQCHCLRILVRLLLIFADMYESDFVVVESVFQFSCDEVCIKLKSGTAVLAASKLSAKIQILFGEMQWQSLLPLRIEMFKLCHIPLDNLSTNMQSLNIKSEEGQTMHTGHPTLRKSSQFVDLPAIHDPAWEKQKLKPLSSIERCDDSYFIRQVYSNENTAEDRYEMQFKKISLQMRPKLILDHMEKNLFAQSSKKKKHQFSPNSKEFIPVTKQIEAPESKDSKGINSLSKNGTHSTGKKVEAPESKHLEASCSLSKNAAPFPPSV